MSTHSTHTVRVREIDQDVSPTRFSNIARSLSSKRCRQWWLPSTTQTGHDNPVTSFALHLDGYNGTITLPSVQHKDLALKEHGTDWKFDDEFDGVTTLSSPIEADVDICAIHGLNGNAFDSWVAKSNQKMWLRDILPTSPPFDKARIMTFGYGSQLFDGSNLSGIHDWSHYLLSSLICHSMGGLVARQAMIRLDGYSHRPEYHGISLERCGLLFLSTPHSGTTEADWNALLVELGSLTSGLRPEIMAYLRSFNPLSTETQEDFANMKIKPPLAAFHETRMTKIVTRESASLNEIKSVSIEGTDHNTICKFDGKFCEGFLAVAGKLRDLRGTLLGENTDNSLISKMPHHPPPAAVNCYLPSDKKFFEGRGLEEWGPLKGRKEDLDSLTQAISSAKSKTAFAITGTGGIGKTAMMLEAAHQDKDQKNIFLIQADDSISLQRAYLGLALRVGPEYLLKEYRGRGDLHAIWSNQSVEEKVDRFKRWLKDPENDNSLFLVDDMDALTECKDRKYAFPTEARNILYTTRDPVYRGALPRRQRIYLSGMLVEDIIELLETVRDSENVSEENTGDLYNHEVLLEIANAVGGHPLAATIAVRYILRVSSQWSGDRAGREFVDTITGGGHEERKFFLEFSPETPSIMENFQVSRNRLSDPGGDGWKLLQLISMLATDCTLGFDYRNFFTHRCPMDPVKFQDHKLLGIKGSQLGLLFNELESVSFGERQNTSQPLQFHPLWLECARHVMEESGRQRHAHQILRICYHTSLSLDATTNYTKDFLPHVQHCLRVYKSFGMKIENLRLPGNVEKWVHVMVYDTVTSHMI
ncbi:uncharacterized protein PAC_13052 [Phialocephala subalpina]|uniref:NB-ARC domain-containing protein n=1 Tax=Phialocephala subalpina TaxID=576137 RepID=A0A1L7XDP5_9HELO|nr:uncharacterized protein PAC_13052 [Phialocephala subalpina]